MSRFPNQATPFTLEKAISGWLVSYRLTKSLSYTRYMTHSEWVALRPRNSSQCLKPGLLIKINQASFHARLWRRANSFRTIRRRNGVGRVSISSNRERNSFKIIIITNTDISISLITFISDSIITTKNNDPTINKTMSSICIIIPDCHISITIISDWDRDWNVSIE